jgi:hypothetical protein
MMERLPQGEEGLDDGYGMDGNGLEVDIDWTTGWSRIEKYLELVEDEGSKSSTDESDDNVSQLRNRNGSPLEKMRGKRRTVQLCEDTNDLALTVEHGTMQTNERQEDATESEEIDEQRPHEFV